MPAQSPRLILKAWYLMIMVRKQECNESDTEIALETYPLRTV